MYDTLMICEDKPFITAYEPGPDQNVVVNSLCYDRVMTRR